LQQIKNNFSPLTGLKKQKLSAFIKKLCIV